jgi:hypothetical protein
MFENWWKERTGIVDVSIPVLPEFMVHQIAEVGALHDRRNKVDVVGHESRTGKELWAYLKPRLRLIVDMQAEWGGINNLYPSRADSIFQVVSLPPGIRDPDSAFSAWWDLIGIVLLVYVAVSVPMRTCFELQVAVMNGEWFCDLFIDVYFVCDLFLNFFTSYFDSKGIREFRKHKIAEHYLRGWFGIDLLSSARPPLPTDRPTDRPAPIHAIPFQSVQSIQSIQSI